MWGTDPVSVLASSTGTAIYYVCTHGTVVLRQSSTGGSGVGCSISQVTTLAEAVAPWWLCCDCSAAFVQRIVSSTWVAAALVSLGINCVY